MDLFVSYLDKFEFILKFQFKRIISLQIHTEALNDIQKVNEWFFSFQTILTTLLDF